MDRSTRGPSVGREFVWGAALVAGLLVLAPAQNARALFSNYGDCDGGGQVVYEQVTEDPNNTGEPNTIFNAPDCLGNQIDFDPTGFIAEVNPGAGSDSIAGELTFTLAAKPGFVLQALTFAESGDYTLLGVDLGTSTGSTMQIGVQITQTVGGAAAVNDADLQSVTFTLPGDFTPTGTADWGLSSLFTFDTILANAGFGPLDRATAVEVTVRNTLAADAVAGEIATIRKKEIEGLSIAAVAVPIPEPTTGLMLGLGIAGLALMRRSSAASD